MSLPSPDRHGSGDLRADRRAALAETYGREGDAAAAADLMHQALQLAPGWALGHVRHAQFLVETGTEDDAATALQAALSLDPDDRYGASLILARLGALPVPDAPPSAFVETLFDDYAPRFEAALRDRLGYVVPELLRDDLMSLTGPAHRFDKALDLGCGTGLVGTVLRPMIGHLVGLDLSQAMLELARAKGVYDTLHQHDLTEPVPLPGGLYDLVTVADVLIYLGDPTPVLSRIAASCRPGGLVALSVEAGPADAAFTLLPSLRYAHGLSALVGAMKACGFEPVSSRSVVIRWDRGTPVDGHVLIAALR